MNHYLWFLIRDELSYLVPEFQQRTDPIIRQKIQDITSPLLEQKETRELSVTCGSSDLLYLLFFWYPRSPLKIKL